MNTPSFDPRSFPRWSVDTAFEAELDAGAHGVTMDRRFRTVIWHPRKQTHMTPNAQALTPRPTL